MENKSTRTPLSWTVIIILYLIIFGLWKFVIDPTIDKMPCVDLSEDGKEFYTDTWPPQTP